MLRNYVIIVLWIMRATAEKECDQQRHPISAKEQSRNCEINVRLDLAGKKTPVILSKTRDGRYELAQPTIRCSHNSYINLKDKRILITCPGKRNSLIFGGPNISESEASCSFTNGHNHFDIGGEEYQTDQLQCARRVTPYELVTSELCSSNGSLLKLGYMVKNEFHDLIQVCHRVVDGRTYYSRHVLDGSHFSRTGNSSKRPDSDGRPRFSFQNRALYRGFPPYKYFSTQAQSKLLSMVTGKADTFDNKHNKFFAKGHLSPNADFLLSTWRDVTFLFVNAQPQWQEINGQNWNEIEKSIRNHAITTGEKYDVITGTQGTLTLNNTKLYLDLPSQRLPVPEHFTKLVREVKSNKCVAFIANNFPLDDEPVHKCEDICLQYRWPDLKDYRKRGYVYCCSYEDMKKAFPNSFPMVDCSRGILENMSLMRSEAAKTISSCSPLCATYAIGDLKK